MTDSTSAREAAGLTPVHDEHAVSIWHANAADVCANPTRVAVGLSWLSDAERARHARYRHDRDRDMFLVGRLMARALVARELGTSPAAWQWREGSRGRPEVDDATAGVSFNLAHSAGTVVCAVTRGRDVGVDVEDRRRPPVERALVRRFCAPAEVADIEAQPGEGWRDRFLTYWTLKEAYLKARGLGIAVHLADVSFTLSAGRVAVTFLNSLAGQDTAWAFEVAELAPHHVLAAAAPVVAGSRPTFTVRPLPLDLLI